MPTELRFPKLDQDMVEGILSEWLISAGDRVSKGTPVAVIETDKVTTELEAPSDGIAVLLAEAGATIHVGTPIATFDDGGNANGTQFPAPAMRVAHVRTPASADTSSVPTEKGAKAGEPMDVVEPAAPRTDGVPSSLLGPLALPVDRSSWPRPHRLPPRRRDRDRVGEHKSVAAPDPSPTKTNAEHGNIQDYELSTVQRTAIQVLERSVRIPQFEVTKRIEMAATLDVLSSLRRDGARLSLTDFLVRAVACAARDVPDVAAALDNGRVYIAEHIDVNLLVAVGRELYNPCIARPAERSLTSVAADRRDLVARCHSHGLSARDLRSGDITLSNLGPHGIDSFTPLLFPPQAAIVGVGSIVDNALTAKLVCDHRIINGSIAAEYVASFTRYLATPINMLI